MYKEHSTWCKAQQYIFWIAFWFIFCRYLFVQVSDFFDSTSFTLHSRYLNEIYMICIMHRTLLSAALTRHNVNQLPRFIDIKHQHKRVGGIYDAIGIIALERAHNPNKRNLYSMIICIKMVFFIPFLNLPAYCHWKAYPCCELLYGSNVLFVNYF